MVATDRGQAHTLEAVVAGMLLLSSVIFALQMTAVTPLSASTSSQHIENQQRSVARGVLAAAAERDALKSTILYWNNSTQNGKFYGARGTGRGDYTQTVPNTTFGGMLERSFDDEGISYNVYLEFRSGTSDRQIQREFIYRGVPSDNAVVAARTVTLTRDDPLYTEDETPHPNLTIGNVSTHPVQNTGGAVYNVVRVEVVAWRI